MIVTKKFSNPTILSTDDTKQSIETTRGFDQSQNFAILGQYNLSAMWQDLFNEYSLVEKLGEGTYGTVMKCVCRATNKTFAIKMIEGFAHYDYELIKLLREIQILKFLNKIMP